MERRIEFSCFGNKTKKIIKGIASCLCLGVFFSECFKADSDQLYATHMPTCLNVECFSVNQALTGPVVCRHLGSR